MTQFRVRQAAELLGISDDTMRRRIEAGQLRASVDASGRRLVDGADLAAFAAEQARPAQDPSRVQSSARNRFVGLVTSVTSDTVMSQVEMVCSGLRVVSLMSTEAVHDLGLAPGVLAVCVIKSTNVIVEIPQERP